MYPSGLGPVYGMLRLSRKPPYKATGPSTGLELIEGSINILELVVITLHSNEPRLSKAERPII